MSRGVRLVGLVVVLICAAAAVYYFRRGTFRTFDAAAMVECLPPDRATNVYLDVDALRRSGILDLVAGSKAAEDPEYRHFVNESGFDYRTDLDAVAAGFLNGNTFLVLRGRFDLKKLSKYAQAQGGNCQNSMCSMTASTPDHFISFYPLASNVLALAVTKEQHCVSMIGPNQWSSPPQMPVEPVCISAPAFTFEDAKSLPAGTQSFLRPLAQAQRITFAIGPDANRLRLRLEVICADPGAAAQMATQLTNTTDLLKKMLERDHMTPNPLDLSGVLTSGKFEQKDERVSGIWPIERGFVAALADGKIQ
jgi:hypothetical protein